MNAVEWLENVQKLDELINAKLAERDRLLTLASSTSSDLDGMPRGTGVSDKVAKIAVKLAMLAAETDELVDQYVDYKAQVVAVLESLPANEYGVLHRYFIQYMTLADIAEEMNYSQMQIWRIKENGVRLIQNAIDHLS